MRQSMMMIELLDTKTQIFRCKTFHSAHMSGCCCMVLCKYLASLMLLQYNFGANHGLESILTVGLIWNN